MTITENGKREIEDDLGFDEAQLQFIEESGLIYEKGGIPRVAGRILGLLSISVRPLNQAEIAHVLQVSRASVSTNLQLGQGFGLVKVTPKRKPGDRRDYYEITPGTWEKAFLNGENEVKEMNKLVRTGLRIIADDNKIARRRLREMEALYECYSDLLHTFKAEWETRKAKLHLDDD